MAVDQPSSAMRSKPPTPGRVIAFSFPRFEHFRLPSGLEVYLAPIDRGPLVSLHLACPGGAWHDSPGEAGRATLAAELLDEGTAGLSAMEIAAQVDNLGGFLSTQADWNASWISLSLLSRHLAPGLGLLARIARGATFPDGEIERLRQQRLANLKARASQPASLAADALAAALYPGTAYGQSAFGTETSVNALGRRELFDFYREKFTPAGSALILAGDLDPARARQAIEETLGDWSGGQALPPRPIQSLASEQTRVILVDRRDAAQTALRIGHSSIPRTHPDFGALQVLNSLLGGKFTSRINLKLREELGITYGANSSFSSRLGPGPFQVATDVDSESAGIGVQEIIGELHRLQEERVDEEELQDAKTYLLGVFPYSLQRIDGLAGRLADLGVAGLPDDYFDRQLEVVSAMDAETIQSLARRHLRPSGLTIVAVGPAETLLPQLESFGETSIVTPSKVLGVAGKPD